MELKIAFYNASDLLTFAVVMGMCIISLTQKSLEHPVTAKRVACLSANVGLG